MRTSQNAQNQGLSSRFELGGWLGRMVCGQGSKEGSEISSSTTISNSSKVKLVLSTPTQTQSLMRYKQLITKFKQVSTLRKSKRKSNSAN